jgi:hypothetical protein
MMAGISQATASVKNPIVYIWVYMCVNYKYILNMGLILETTEQMWKTANSILLLNISKL